MKVSIFDLLYMVSASFVPNLLPLGAVQYLLYNRDHVKSFLEPRKVKTPAVTNHIGPCQYVYEKSVGPVGALTVGHSQAFATRGNL